MTNSVSHLVVSHDERRHKFVVQLDGREAYLRYVRAGARTLHYTRTFVPPEHRRRGIGAHLVTYALDYAREHHFAVVPMCPFVQRVAERRRG